MKIIVTGGAGFIASHIVDAYLLKVTGSMSSMIFPREVSSISTRCGASGYGVADAEAANVILTVKPDVLNHHAAQMDVRHSVEDPLFDAGVNILGFLNLLEACKKAGTAQGVFCFVGRRHLRR